MRRNAILFFVFSLSLASCQEAVLINEVISKAEEEHNRKQIEEKQRNTVTDGTVVRQNEGSNTTSEVEFKDGKKNGLARQMYSNGQVWKESPYKDGQLHGVAKVYDREGRLKRMVAYEKGRKHGPYVLYFKSGKEKARLEYDHELPLPGILELDYKGEEKEQPQITIAETDKLAEEGTYYFTIGLEGKNPEEIYILTARSEWSSENPKLASRRLTLNENGEADLPLKIEKGYHYKADWYIYAVYKSSYDLTAVVSKAFTAEALHY